MRAIRISEMIAGDRSSERAAEHVSFLLPRMAAHHHSLTQSFLFASLRSHRTPANDICLQQRLGYTGHHRLAPPPRVRNRNTSVPTPRSHQSTVKTIFFVIYKHVLVTLEARSAKEFSRPPARLAGSPCPGRARSATRFAHIAICRSNQLYIQSVCPSLCDHILLSTELADRP